MSRFRQRMYKMQDNMVRFMYGRYGQDYFSRTTYIAAIILMIVNLFTKNGILYLISTALLGYTIFRMMSRNIAKRRAENAWFCKIMKKPVAIFKVIKLSIKDRKTSRYYICKCCSQTIRVPKGKGRIEITCPKCRNKFIKCT